MKKLKRFILVSLAVAAVTLVSCKKTNPDTNRTNLSELVAGTYSGELKNSLTSQTVSASLDVTAINDSMISLHCVSEVFDTTIQMYLYENNDSVMVCLTGQDFYNEYGHYLDNHNFCNNMPQGWSSNWEGNHDHWWGDEKNMWNAWNNHMNTQHSPGDMHYGGFDTGLRSCTYSFKIVSNSSTYYRVFTGLKSQN